MQFKEFASWMFFSGWSCIGIYVASSINRVSKSVEALNVNVAVVVEKVGNHEKRIDKLERKDR